MFKLVATSSLLLAVATMLPSAVADCPAGTQEVDITCGEGQIRCWVFDPTRTVAPWKGSTQTWPQCYTPMDITNTPANGTYVCTENFYLCPSGAPINCGQQCMANTTSPADYATCGAKFDPSANQNYKYPSIYTNATTNATSTWTVLPSTYSRGCVTPEIAKVINENNGGGSASGSGSTTGTAGASGSASGSSGTSGSGSNGSAGKSQSSASTQTVSMMLGSLLAAALITIF